MVEQVPLFLTAYWGFDMSYERELGGVQEKLKKLESEVSEMRDDVREIRDVVVSVKGGWKTIAVIASLSAAVGAAMIKFLTWVSFLPR